MNKHTIAQFERSFKELVKNEHENSEGYCIIVKTTDDWENPLPEHVKNANYMRIDITEWSRKESYIDNSGIYVKTAFKEDENSKFFTFEDIQSLLTHDGEMIITKPYLTNNEEKKQLPEPETKHTMKSIMHTEKQEKSAGVKHSMSKLSLVKLKKNTKEKTSKKKKKSKKKDKGQ